jgi:ankyrin repeat protein
MNNHNDILYTAVETGNLEQVRNLLYDPEFQVNIKLSTSALNGTDQGTVLLEASSKGYNEIVKLLFQNRADVSIADVFVHMNRFDVAKTLIDKGADVNAGLVDVNETPLMVAAGVIGRKPPCQREMLELLINSGAVVDAENLRAMTALHMACRSYSGGQVSSRKGCGCYFV